MLKFLVKINALDNDLVYANYIGWSDIDVGGSITHGVYGVVYIIGMR